jgi:hypothetical protein
MILAAAFNPARDRPAHRHPLGSKHFAFQSCRCWSGGLCKFGRPCQTAASPMIDSDFDAFENVGFCCESLNRSELERHCASMASLCETTASEEHRCHGGRVVQRRAVGECSMSRMLNVTSRREQTSFLTCSDGQMNSWRPSRSNWTSSLARSSIQSLRERSRDVSLSRFGRRICPALPFPKSVPCRPGIFRLTSPSTQDC